MVLPLVLFAGTYVLIASEKIDRSIAAILGATAMIALGVIKYDEALRFIDLNVIFLLVGMMMIVSIMARTGMFEYLAMLIAQKARGNGLLILILFLLSTAVLSSLLDNVTTVILIAPLTILITQVLELPTVPFLVLEAIFSNIGGTSTLVGDPPNIIIGSQAGLSFNDFVYNLGPVILVIAVVTIIVVWLVLGNRIVAPEYARRRVDNAIPRMAIVDPKSLWGSLGVFTLVILGFFLGRLVHIEPGIIALGGGFLMALVCRVEVHGILKRVEWTTIMFFVGLFMLVGALEVNGVFVLAGEWIIDLTKGNLMLTCLVVLWSSALFSAVVDNIPLVIAMSPLILTLIPGFAEHMGIAANAEAVASQVKEPLFWSLALGACLGGNGTLVGASANVVISQLAKNNNYHLSFWTFSAWGFPLMLLSLVICTGYIYVRYFVL